MTEFFNDLQRHSGKWYEVVVYAKVQDDPGEVIAKFTSPTDALWFAKKQQEGGVYNLVVVR